MIDRPSLQSPQVARFLRRLLKDAADALHADESSIWIASADGTELEAALNHGPNSAIVETLSVPVADSVIGLVLTANNGMCIGPDDRHNESVDRATGIRTKAMAAVPIVAGQSSIGVMSAINPRDALTFDHEDLDELTWRAYLAGVIIRDHLEMAAVGE